MDQLRQVGLVQDNSIVLSCVGFYLFMRSQFELFYLFVFADGRLLRLHSRWRSLATAFHRRSPKLTRYISTCRTSDLLHALLVQVGYIWYKKNIFLAALIYGVRQWLYFFQIDILHLLLSIDLFSVSLHAIYLLTSFVACRPFVILTILNGVLGSRVITCSCYNDASKFVFMSYFCASQQSSSSLSGLKLVTVS